MTFRMTRTDDELKEFPEPEFRTDLLGCSDHDDPCPLNFKVLNIGLPDQHHVIQDCVDQNDSLAHHNLAGVVPAVARTIHHIIDKCGWTANLDTIISSLTNNIAVSSNYESLNSFAGATIKLFVRNKLYDWKNGDIAVEVNIQSQKGEELDKNVFRTVPCELGLHTKMIGMVLTWNMWNCTKNMYTPVAIFAKDFDSETKKYRCITGLGDPVGFPEIHNSDIVAIHYVTIKQLFT